MARQGEGCFLIKLIKLILYNRTFEFYESYWKQYIGGAMGSKPVPHYANIFMSKIERKLKLLQRKKNLHSWHY